MPRHTLRQIARPSFRNFLILATLLCSMLVSSSVQARQQSSRPASADSPSRAAQPLAPPDSGNPPTPPRLGLPPRDFVPGPLRAGAPTAPTARRQARPSEPAAMTLARPPVILPYSTCLPGLHEATSAGRAQGAARGAAARPAKRGAAYPCRPPFTIGPGTVVASATSVHAASAARGASPGRRRAAAAARTAGVVNPVIRQVNVATSGDGNSGNQAATVYV